MGYPIPGGQHLILMYASKTKEIHQAIHMNVHTHTCIYVRYTCVCITILIKKSEFVNLNGVGEEGHQRSWRRKRKNENNVNRVNV